MVPFFLAALVALSIILFVAGIRFADTSSTRAMQNTLAPVVDPKLGLITEGTVKMSLWQRYKMAWTKAGLAAGYTDSISNNLGYIVVAMAFIVASIIFALTQVIVLSVFVSLAPAAFLWLRVTTKASKRSLQIEKQMSSFVVSIHMYIQSGLQPVTAIMQAVEACPQPLQEELTYLVFALKNNENERLAFRKLRDRTTNPELKELCSNISIALAEGSDIGKQLMNLGETVRAKGELRGKIQNLLQDPRMTSVIGFLSFFVFFAISWFSQENAQETWSSLQGSLVLALLSCMAAAGGVWAFRIVKKVQEVA